MDEKTKSGEDSKKVNISNIHKEYKVVGSRDHQLPEMTRPIEEESVIMKDFNQLIHKSWYPLLFLINSVVT